MSGAGFWSKIADRQATAEADRRAVADCAWLDAVAVTACLVCGRADEFVLFGQCRECDGWPDLEAPGSSDHRPELQGHKPPHMKRTGRDGACPQPGVSPL